MSRKKDSAKTGTEANEHLYDPFTDLEIPVIWSEDFKWPEWSDAQLNAEKWDIKEKGKSSPKSADKKARPLFEDPDPTPLLPEIEKVFAEWKRPSEFFTDDDVILYDPSVVDVCIYVQSTLLEKCILYQHMIGVVRKLSIQGTQEPFPVEGESPLFTPNTQGLPWRPWHHVYALCKAGKGQVHKPHLNPYGKYVVRLFVVGCWRKIVVDDRIPVDADGKALVPLSRIPGELWPVLLTKAILKLVGTTGCACSNYFSSDFVFATALFGWIREIFKSTDRSSEDDVWRVLTAYCPHYEWPPEEGEKKPPESAKKKGKKTEKGSKGKKSVEDAKSSKSSKRGKEIVIKDPFILTLYLKTVPLDTLHEPFHILEAVMTRDIPLVRCNRRPNTEPWKRIRWVYWAARKGIWTDELLIPPFRCIKIITFNEPLINLLKVDTETEKRLFDVPSSGTMNNLIRDYQGPSTVPDIERWTDFYAVYKYVFKYTIFYKTLAFPCRIHVTNLPLGLSKKGSKSPRGAPTNFPTIYKYVPRITPTKNEALMLFFDAAEPTYCNVTLSIYPKESLRCFGYVDPEQPIYIRPYHAGLIVEKYDWRTAEMSEIVGMIRTVGTHSCPLHLNKGRHIFRIWLQTESSYVIRIHTNAAATVGRGFLCREFMINESFRVADYVNKMANSFQALCRDFGTRNYKKALPEFYKEIRPDRDIDIHFYKKCILFYDVFFKVFLNFLRSVYTSDDEFRVVIMALRVLFINPDITYPLPRQEMAPKKAASKHERKRRHRTPSPPKSSLDFSSREYMEEEITAAIVIQKYYRTRIVQKLQALHNPTAKEHKLYYDKLKKLCDSVFAASKREANGGKIVRSLLLFEEGLRSSFKFGSDVEKVIQKEQFSGSVTNVGNGAWLPIVRVLLQCHSEEPVPCAVHLSCNLIQTILCVVNNDTLERMFQLTQSVAPVHYSRNRHGYTVFAYGWPNTENQSINWRLEIITLKYYPLMHCCNLLNTDLTCFPYTAPNLHTVEIKDNYLPNHRYQIAKCLIRIKQRSLMSFRFSVSYRKVQFRVRILDGHQNVVAESETCGETEEIASASSQESVVIPAVVLDLNREEPAQEPFVNRSSFFNETLEYSEVEPVMVPVGVYTLEAHVLHNTWPLTIAEWAVVELARIRGGDSILSSVTSRLSKKSKKSGIGSKQVSGETLSQLDAIERPFWVLQAVQDVSASGSTEDVLVERDTSVEDTIRALKRSWEENDPGRKKRGQMIRREFLLRMWEEEQKSLLSVGEACVEEDFVGFYLRGTSLTNTSSTYLSSIDEEQLIESMSTLLTEKSSVRSYTSPRVIPRILDRELVKFGQGMENERRVRSRESEMSFLDSLDHEGDEYWEMLREMEIDRKILLGQEKHRRFILDKHLEKERSSSLELMERAYEFRSKILSSLKPKSKKEKKKKK